MAKFKNIFYVVLLLFLFVEVLIIFPDRLEKSAAKEREQARAQRLARGEPEEDPADPSAAGQDATDSKEKKPDEKKSTSGVAEQRMKGMQVVESQGAKRDWELFSVAAESGQNGQGKNAGWNLHQVRALFYNNEKVDFTVTGDEGSVDPNTKDLKIRGHVVTKSANGYTFETPSILYNAGTRIIESPEQVVMRGPSDENGEGMFLKGAAMIVYVDSSRMLINSTVTAEKNMKEKKKLSIRSDKAEFSGKNREARFMGNVAMNYDKMKIEGPEARFVYQANKDVLSTILVQGGVKVSDVDKFAVSENLNLDVLANKFTFRGKPKIIQNNDELVGDEITFLDGGKRVKVDKVRARMDDNQEKQ